MEQVVDDPFIAQPREPHSALSEEHEISFDIQEQLFEEFFESDEFRHWSTGQKHWQLHCYGGPGCGKVRPLSSSTLISR
jgi:hypothetical protein